MLRAALLFAVALVLAACAALPEAPPAPQGGFELEGRVGVRYGADGASGRFSWRHAPDSDDLLITSPLGQGVAELRRRGKEVQLVAEGKQYRAEDAEALTEQVLGWRLPLQGLPAWVQGRASPGSPAEVERRADGRVSTLFQQDWKIEYQEFDGDRPSRMRLSRPGLEIRLIIDRWAQ